VNRLAEIVMEVAGKELRIRHIPGPLGVRGRNSDNRLIQSKLGWEPKFSLERGLDRTYHWILQQIERQSAASLAA